jgi:hypothetical protein
MEDIAPGGGVKITLSIPMDKGKKEEIVVIMKSKDNDKRTI